MGEWGIIAALARRMPAGPLTSVGIGDDAAVVGAPSGSVVAAVDFLLEGRHFRRDWSSAYDIGVKAAARSLADIAAMGAVNTALLVALAVPGGLPATWPLELADGLAAEAARAGAGIVGGDTARADSVLLSVTALGDLAGRAPVLRSGARPGDVIAVAGPLGRSAAGLALLSAGVPATSDALAGLVTAHRRPSPPYEAGPEAAALGATAMIDVSDGLLADLGHIADASAVALDLNRAALEPGDPLGEAYAALKGKTSSSRTVPADSPPPTPLEWVLTGGEDHSLVATFPASTQLPSRWRVIGQVRAATNASTATNATNSSTATPGAGVTTPAKAGLTTVGVTIDGATHPGPPGWQHFR